MNLYSERRNIMLQKLEKIDYTVSNWSGGTTTQIAIWPPNALYADRDFLWRISSATVDLEESDFTPLPDYERLISTLEGEIVLTHNGGEPIKLRPFEVHAFSGADATHSRGRCRDFNLMLRRGCVIGTMQALRLSDTPTILNAGAGVAGLSFPAEEQVLLYCVEGEATAYPHCHREPETDVTGAAIRMPSFTLAPGEALLVTEPVALTIFGPSAVMVCHIRK